MRIIPLTLLAMLLASLQHAWLIAPGAPDLSLALLAVVWPAGVPQRAAIRGWIVGTLTDLADPGSVVFHALAFTALAVVYSWCERFLQRGPLGQGLLAATLALALGGIDAALSAVAGPGILALLSTALWTGLAAIALSWLVAGIPEGLRPVAARERRPLTRLSLTL